MSSREQNRQANIEAYAKKNGIDLTTLNKYDHTETVKAFHNHIANWANEDQSFLTNYSVMLTGAVFVDDELILLRNDFQEQVYFALRNDEKLKVYPVEKVFEFKTSADFAEFILNDFGDK